MPASLGFRHDSGRQEQIRSPIHRTQLIAADELLPSLTGRDLLRYVRLLLDYDGRA